MVLVLFKVHQAAPVEKITKYEIDKMVATEIELECLIVLIVSSSCMFTTIINRLSIDMD